MILNSLLLNYLKQFIIVVEVLYYVFVLSNIIAVDHSYKLFCFFVLDIHHVSSRNKTNVVCPYSQISFIVVSVQVGKLYYLFLCCSITAVLVSFVRFVFPDSLFLSIYIVLLGLESIVKRVVNVSPVELLIEVVALKVERMLEVGVEKSFGIILFFVKSSLINASFIVVNDFG